MYRRITALLLTIAFIMLPIAAFADSGFSSKPKAIDQAAKSVLMLQVFDANDEEIATGSGFVAFNNRTIITNHHVIEGADWMLANSDDGYQYMVTKVLVADEEKDIAICEFMSPTDLQPLEFNTDGELMRAESIVAIGSPIGITNTVSLGNISALYKDEGVSWIQFTAPISHGSSGGALFDNDGKIIGVTSATYIDTQNLNLAVHISEVEALYNSWDGSKTSFAEFMATANATPTPAPTAVPTPMPTSIKNPNDVYAYKYLAKGATGTSVMRLQEALINLGYMSGSPSGYYDDETGIAVSLFNQIHFLKDSNVANRKMQMLLFEGYPLPYNGNPIPCNPNSTPKPTKKPQLYKTLKKGDSGESVKRLQIKLIQLGYLGGNADGIYGSQTEKAVLAFNKQHFSMSTKTAYDWMQELLFEGNPKPYRK